MDSFPSQLNVMACKAESLVSCAALVAEVNKHALLKDVLIRS